MSGCDECRKRRVAGGEAGLERRTLLLAGVTGAAAFALPGCGGAQSSAPRDGGGDGDGEGQDGGEEAESGACAQTCTTGSKTMTLTFEKYPTLKNVGGSVIVSPPGYSDPVCHNDFVIVVQETAGSFIALSASCTHECCQVAWESNLHEFHCPCHGSTYSSTGVVTLGPATMDLPKLSACSDACGVYVTWT
jgi:cytochrome b6-f complex iron-sulfur subunit